MYVIVILIIFIYKYDYMLQLMNDIVTCNVTTLLHIFLNITESRKQVPSTAHTSQLMMTGISHTTAEANTCTLATAGARF